MESVIDNVIGSYSSKVEIIEAKLDINNSEYDELGEEYEVFIIPTLIFLDSEGEVFFRREGFYDEEYIEDVFTNMGIE